MFICSEPRASILHLLQRSAVEDLRGALRDAGGVKGSPVSTITASTDTAICGR
jgi:hypothetical protein